MEKKIGVISAILESPEAVQSQFNTMVSTFKGIIKARTGVPFEEGISVVTIIVVGTVNEINHLTGKLGQLKDVSVKTSISKRALGE